VLQATRTLDAAGLLTAGAFRHAQARAAVISGMTPEERAELHCRAAELRHGRGADATVVAHHLVAAGGTPPSWGATTLPAAADQALARDDIGFATACLRLASRGELDAEQSATIHAALADAQWRVDPMAVARRLPELVTASRSGHLRDRSVLMVARFLLWFGQLDEALSLLERVNLQDDSDPAMQPEARATRLLLLSTYPQRAALAGSLAALEGPAPGLAPDGLRLVADALAARVDENTVVARAEQLLGRLPVNSTTLTSHLAALTALIYADRSDRAQPWCRSLSKEPAVRGVPSWRAFFAAMRAEIAFRRGDLQTAEEDATAALTDVSPQGWGVAVGGPLAIRIRAAVAMGKHDEAARYLDLPVPPAMYQTIAGLHYRTARGHFALATGRFESALADFLWCGESMSKWTVDAAGIVPWRIDAAQARLRLGQPELADQLIDEQLATLGPGQYRARGRALRLRAATVPLEQRPALLQDAVRALHTCGDRLEQAYALADLSQAFHDLGGTRPARTTALRACRTAKACGARTLVASLSASTTNDRGKGAEPDLPEDPDLFTELSEAERRVAILAACGDTNRQIANQLFVTVSTVEQHLTRVYRKLGVSRRMDLPAWLRTDLPDTESKRHESTADAPAGRRTPRASIRPRALDRAWIHPVSG
jgi:DNA-binding CsgD family transcriptional regulator